MARTPPSLEQLVERLTRLPGVGRRTADRLAHHLLRVPVAEAVALADAIREARERIRPCAACNAPSETDPCDVCADPTRDPARLLVVETARDLRAIEDAGAWRGRYHVLGGRVAAVEGVGAEHLAIAALAARVTASQGAIAEVVVATNPDLDGDGTALHVEEALSDLPVAVTRLARGLPAGGSLEFVSRSVLAEAIERRRAEGAPPRREGR